MHERHVDFARNRKRTFFQRTHFDIFPQRGEKSLNTVRSNLSRKRKKKKAHDISKVETKFIILPFIKKKIVHSR